jgi:hypothetical protein
MARRFHPLSGFSGRAPGQWPQKMRSVCASDCLRPTTGPPNTSADQVALWPRPAPIVIMDVAYAAVCLRFAAILTRTVSASCRSSSAPSVSHCLVPNLSEAIART